MTIFRNGIAIITIALLTQIVTAYKGGQFASTLMQHDQNATLSDNTNWLKILLSRNNTYQPFQYIQDIQSDIFPNQNNSNAAATTIKYQLTKSPIKKAQTNGTKKKTLIINQKPNTTSISDIVKNIQSRQFSVAEKQLQQKDTRIKYEDVVAAAYNHDIHNIELLRSFGDCVSNAEHKFVIFNALLDQIKANRQRDALELIRIYQSVKKDVFGRTTNTSAAQTLVDSVEHEIQKAAIESLSAGFINDDSWQSVNILSTNLFDNFPRFVPSIFNEVIDTVFERINDTQKLLDEASGINQLESEIIVYQAIFDRLEIEDKLNTSLSISLARNMKAIIDHKRFKTLSPSWKTPLERLKKKLPEGVKTLVFSTAICIKNPKYNEYLYASDVEHGGFGHDDQRRSVYTGVSENRTKLPEFKWYVEFTEENQFKLVNEKFNENLFACFYRSYNDDKTRRMVFTYRGMGSLVGSGEGSMIGWNAEVDGKALQLRHDRTKEYLFADQNEKQSDNRRYVFTYIPKRPTAGSKWEIIDCSNSS